MENEVKYNVKTTINTENLEEKDLIKLFNEKLFNIIFSLEKENILKTCQD